MLLPFEVGGGGGGMGPGPPAAVALKKLGLGFPCGGMSWCMSC